MIQEDRELHNQSPVSLTFYQTTEFCLVEIEIICRQLMMISGIERVENTLNLALNDHTGDM